MAPLKTYRELEVWQRSMDLVVEVYKLSAALPVSEKYGLISQMQRCAVSIPANIAEGYGRTHRGDYLRFLSIAKGSLAELETYLVILERLGFAQRDEINEVWTCSQIVGRMLTRLIASLNETLNPKPQPPDPEK